jgi:hypothetical protein
MALLQASDRGPHPQAVANLAQAQVTLEALLIPGIKADEEWLQLVRDERREELDDDALRPATGIVNGLRLSVTLWSFIALVVLLMR